MWLVLILETSWMWWARCSFPGCAPRCVCLRQTPSRINSLWTHNKWLLGLKQLKKLLLSSDRRKNEVSKLCATWVHFWRNRTLSAQRCGVGSASCCCCIWFWYQPGQQRPPGFGRKPLRAGLVWTCRRRSWSRCSGGFLWGWWGPSITRWSWSPAGNSTSRVRQQRWGEPIATPASRPTCGASPPGLTGRNAETDLLLEVLLTCWCFGMINKNKTYHTQSGGKI